MSHDVVLGGACRGHQRQQGHKGQRDSDLVPDVPYVPVVADVRDVPVVAPAYTVSAGTSGSTGAGCWALKVSVSCARS